MLLRQSHTEDTEPFTQLHAARHLPSMLTREHSDAMLARARMKIVEHRWGL